MQERNFTADTTEQFRFVDFANFLQATEKIHIEAFLAHAVQLLAAMCKENEI